MSGHVLFGVDLGEIEESTFYELESKLHRHKVLELLPYFVGDECIVLLKGTQIDADYGSLVTEIPKLEVAAEKIEAFKSACAELEIDLDGEEPKWLLTFVGNE